MGDNEQPSGTEPVCSSFTGFKKRKDRGNVRKRANVSDDEGEARGSSVVRSSKAKKESAIEASSSKGKTGGSTRFAYESNRQVQTHNDQGATKMLETETATDRDARALREQVLEQGKDETRPNIYAGGEAVYKGTNAYTDYRAGFRREQTIASEKGAGAHGPIRANTTVRGTFIMDYKPDLCKDYKETGYCGYGDSCKFMHDRGDYKSGWELDKEWDEKEKTRKREEALRSVGEAEEESDEEDDLPFACLICHEAWSESSDPVVTLCEHYFCEHCAIKHSARSKACYVCELPTKGVFNAATKIKQRLKDAANGIQQEPREKDSGPSLPEQGHGGWVFPSGGTTSWL
ncbi:hypothetical protein CYMTET_54666 [Cymbomonas tetramitiformis]|uniref:Uncharacterized protein n=1 Tax=Cymbomonas tetramitiformis TaxID=36881 RepID=A0AAE0BG90_9CHLO|nr:hypothetical protein CYMTET_54666 [Cymbomonas tetramitiformis]|eukprot:gene9950-11781_t